MFKYEKNRDGSLLVYDPIYGKIKVEEPFVSIIFTKEMFRLKDITQNGFSYYEFPNLEENDRLSHSVGAYHVMSLILNHLENKLKPYHIKFSQDDKDIALCSMLIHDIGHGPGSHSFEVAVDYSHEKRTADILLGNTEIHGLLLEKFGLKKLKKIASFIADINEQEENHVKNSFMKLLKNLVSHQLDADRLDYLARDAFYVGNPSPFDLDKIISNLNVVVNNNQEYELVIHRNALASTENVLITRYQMYRDVYLSPISVLGDRLFCLILKRYLANPLLHKLNLSKTFRLAAQGGPIPLSDFLEMKESDLRNDYEILKHNKIDPVIAYLCDVSKISDYILLEREVKRGQLEQEFQEVFGLQPVHDSNGIIQINTRTVFYKKEQKLNIQNHNRICDITECTNLIRPQEVLENSYTFVNPVLCQLELGCFDKVEKGAKEKMLEHLDKKPVEFELKYIIEADISKESLKKQVLSLFMQNGYQVVEETQKENSDDYFDTCDFALWQKGASLRVRQATNQNGKKKIKGTFKDLLGENQVYSSRNEIEFPLEEASYDSLMKEMKSISDCDFSKVHPSPVLNSCTKRTDILLEKDGYQVCVSLDDTIYSNYMLFGTMASDRMIEIEAKGAVINRVMLNEIHDFVSNGMRGLQINTDSKYQRGIKKTYYVYRDAMQEKNPELESCYRQLSKIVEC